MTRETGGELYRRIAATAGPRRGARRPNAARRRSPRWRVASLLASTELAAATLGAMAAQAAPPLVRTDRHPVTVAATMYAAPTIPALLGRLEQDRRLLVLARTVARNRAGRDSSEPRGGELPRVSSLRP